MQPVARTEGCPPYLLSTSEPGGAAATAARCAIRALKLLKKQEGSGFAQLAGYKWVRMQHVLLPDVLKMIRKFHVMTSQPWTTCVLAYIHTVNTACCCLRQAR